MKKDLALFDFDGTITNRDSFLYFLRFTHTLPEIIRNVLLVSPHLILFKLGIISNEKAKQKLFSQFYKGISKDQFDTWARNFLPQIDSFVKSKALERIQYHILKGDRVIVVSAGFDMILKYWCEKSGVELLATCVEVKNNLLTGNFLGPNCFGQEKVNRINSILNTSDYNQIFGYGDSSGDIEMMKISTEALHTKKIFE